MPSPEGGTVHIVVGDGGNYEGPALYEGHPPGWRQPQPLWSAFREASYGPGTGGGLQTWSDMATKRQPLLVWACHFL